MAPLCRAPAKPSSQPLSWAPTSPLPPAPALPEGQEGSLRCPALRTPIPAGSYLALLQTRAFSHPAAAHLIPLTKCLAPSFAGMGWDGMGLNGMGLNGMGWGMQPFHCAPSPAEEQDLCRGRIWPLQGHRDANFSQKQWITAHQLQSILCRGRKQREKRNKKRFLSCRGFGGFVVFGGRKKKKV